MSGTYKATGINLKGMAFGESDRMLTVLTREYGLIRAIAPGSRKHQSSLRGRSGLFVVNELLIAKGKSLDKIIQAESVESFPGLSQDLPKLTASQYLAEIALYQALSDQPQEELFLLLQDALRRLEQLPPVLTLACLTHTTFHLLSLAGISPQVHACCLTQQPLEPDFDNPDWRVGFSVTAGGTIDLVELGQQAIDAPLHLPTAEREAIAPRRAADQASSGYKATKVTTPALKPGELNLKLNAIELALLQQLAAPDLIQTDGTLRFSSDQPLPQPSDPAWLSLERALRHYAEYYFERPIRSAALIDACFLSPAQSLSS
jgi:DNA repair protein RecO (recombination protein O)